MTKDTIIFVGALVGLIAAILAIIDRVLSIRERLATAKGPAKVISKDIPPRPRRWPALVFPYLTQEVLVIVAASLLLNYLGLAVAVRLKSVLYLDMTGTALAAFLLGPWWGAITGLVSNSFVNWLLYPEPRADLIVFPWSLVNMTGGVFWGILARRIRFREYLANNQASVGQHFRYLMIYGVLGAGVMSAVGTMVQAALSQKAVLALDPRVASAMDTLLMGTQGTLRSIVSPIFGSSVGDTFAWVLPSWVQNWLRYIPDKTLSVAFALATMRYGFPIFERELIRRAEGNRGNDNWTSPLILGVLYVPSFLVLLSSNIYRSSIFWFVWSAPWIFVFLGICYNIWRGPTRAAIAKRRERRLEVYQRFHGALRSAPVYAFFQRMNYATLGASAVFVLGLPLLEVDFYRVTFNFLCVVYGGLLGIYVIRIAVCQNIALARSRNGGREENTPIQTSRQQEPKPKP